VARHIPRERIKEWEMNNQEHETILYALHNLSAMMESDLIDEPVGTCDGLYEPMTAADVEELAERFNAEPLVLIKYCNNMVDMVYVGYDREFFGALGERFVQEGRKLVVEGGNDEQRDFAIRRAAWAAHEPVSAASRMAGRMMSEILRLFDQTLGVQYGATQRMLGSEVSALRDKTTELADIVIKSGDMNKRRS
jgi:hypothetical protein